MKKFDSSSNRTPVQEQVSKPTPAAAKSSSATTRSEFNYVNQILKRAGINRETPVSSFTRWFSSSHPLDPCLFHFLEAESHPEKDELSPACNRKLMFDLVDEILAHIIPPHKSGEWGRLHGFQVMRMVCTKVKAFPRADCKILQDIDELVEIDLSAQGSSFFAGEEEEDDIVAAIQKDLVEALLLDTAVAMAGRDNGYFLTRRPNILSFST